jgi:RND superfamily putative drug exporter
MGGYFTDDVSLPGTSAQQGADLLRAHFPDAGGQTGLVVFSVRSGSLTHDHGAVELATANVRRLPHVQAVSDPLGTDSIAKDGRTAYATVHFSVAPQDLGLSYVRQVNQAVGPARAAGISVNYGGQLGQAAQPGISDRLSEEIGITTALLILLIGFGSVIGALLPIVSALLGAFTGLAIVGLLTAAIAFATVSPVLAIMMGLGVGIDYALFLSTRYRQLTAEGISTVDAVGRTLASSGRAVVIAAFTVVIALLSLYASGIVYIGKLGLAAGLTVAVAAAGALTIVPASLGLTGRRIDRLRVRRPRAEFPADVEGWLRYARRVSSHPVRYLAGGVAVLAVLAVPALSMQLGQLDAGSAPPTSTSRQAYDTLSANFGVGVNGPLTVVVQLDPRAVTAAGDAQPLTAALRAALARVPDVAAVTPVRATPDGALLYVTVIPGTSPQSEATSQLVADVRDRVLPSLLAPDHASGYVTGSLAGQLQFRDEVGGRLRVIIGTIIAAAFILLLLSFRSLVLAVKAAVLNLLSIGAAYGVLVAVFQWGWGSSLLGVDEKVPIESYVPMIMFAIVFGLSMDYEVFLLTRVREARLRTGEDQRSVAYGLAATGRVITCAALIMACVFFSFVLTASVVVKMLALGLALSVIIDASVVRLVVVPAVMFLLGRHNWWLPGWLDRALPGETMPEDALPVREQLLGLPWTWPVSFLPGCIGRAEAGFPGHELPPHHPAARLPARGPEDSAAATSQDHDPCLIGGLTAQERDNILQPGRR